MIIFKKTDLLSFFIDRQRSNGRKIGFAPTMGALHAGHLSLIREARKGNDLVISSIFINPTQFNNPEDLKHYPVTIEKDIEALIGAGCDVLFLPGVDEIYPAGYKKKRYDLGELEHILEGRFRPGHFQGVSEVIDLLLDIVKPDQLYMGQKDFQQCMVVKRLLQVLNKEKSIVLHIVPTVRETDGLAMSSRNLRLNKEERQRAPALFRELSKIREDIGRVPQNRLKEVAREHLERDGFAVDYVEIARSVDLRPPAGDDPSLVALVAATIGKIRLIDNLILN